MVEKTVLSINYIVQTPGICGGYPRIDGTRITVDWIAGQMLYAGRTLEEMLEDYAHIPLLPAHLHAALAYYYDHQDEIDELILESEELVKTLKLNAVNPEDDYVTAKEAAEILGVDHASRQVAKLCRDDVLACRKVANRWIVSRSSLEAYKNSDRKPGRKPAS